MNPWPIAAGLLADVMDRTGQAVATGTLIGSAEGIADQHDRLPWDAS